MAGEPIEVPGAGGGTAVADPPVEPAAPAEPIEPTEPTEPSEPTEPAQPTEPTEPGDKPPAEEPEIEADGRKVDAKTRSALAKLAQTDKEAAKALRDIYFRDQALLKEIPGAQNTGDVIKAIRSMSATLEAAGGEEGIGKLTEEVEDYRTEIKQFAAGDRALIEQLFSKENPKPYITMTQHAVDVLEENLPSALDDMLLPRIDKRLETAGIYSAIQTLDGLIKEGKGQEAFDLNRKIAKALGDLRDASKKASEGRKETKPVDPEREKLDREREEVAKEKQSIYTQNWTRNVNQLNNVEINKLVGPLAKQLSLNPEGRSDFVNGLVSRIWKALANDKVHVKRASAIRAKGDLDAHVKFVHNAFVELLPTAFEQYRNVRYPNIGSKPKPAAPASPNGKPAAAPVPVGPPVKVNARPKHDDVDWSKTPDIMWITGKAVLKNGKSVTFDRNSPPNK